MTKRDVQLVHRAVREGWPIAAAVRERIVTRLRAVLEDGDTKPAVVVAVAHFLVAMSRANLAGEAEVAGRETTTRAPTCAGLRRRPAHSPAFTPDSLDASDTAQMGLLGVPVLTNPVLDFE